MTYEIETKNAYRNKKKASAYLSQYVEGTKWARFTMWKQKKILNQFFNDCNLVASDVILDIPCGTGYIGQLLSSFPSSVVASDISFEMMDLAKQEYENSKFHGFFQADITNTPFKNGYFKCVVVLALMHRLPREIRKEVLEEVFKLSNQFVIISYSESSFLQELKQKVLLIVNKSHVPAPASIPLNLMEEEIAIAGFRIIKKRNIMKFLSAKVVFYLEKVEVK